MKIVTLWKTAISSTEPFASRFIEAPSKRGSGVLLSIVQCVYTHTHMKHVYREHLSAACMSVSNFFPLVGRRDYK